MFAYSITVVSSCNHAGFDISKSRGSSIESSKVATSIKKFESQFRKMNLSIYTELVEKGVSSSDLLLNLTLLPAKLMDYAMAIQDRLQKLMLTPQHGISELFYRIVNPLLSFIDYGLLEHIITIFGSDDLKKDMKAYSNDIQAFMNETTIKQLINHLPGKAKSPPHFEILKAKIDKDASTCTLAEIECMRRGMCSEVKLSDIVFRLIALQHSNSFIISFIVPSVLLPDVIESARKLDNSFFQRESIAFFYIRNGWLYSPKLLQFGAQLKERYQQSLVSIFPSELIPSPTKKIFRLAMIQREKVQQGQIKDAFVRMSISGKVDDILRAKIPIGLNDILRSTFHGGEIVLVEGAPGSGKSTFTIHICKKWGRGELFEQFSVVILVQLRDPAVQRAKSIADLLPCQDVAVAQEYASEIIATNGRGILWVLDGWDELPPHLQQDSIFRSLLPPPPSHQQFQQIKDDPQDSILHSLLPQRSHAHKEKLLHECSVIVTSRPISSGDLHPVISSRIEVLGFTLEEQRQYFTECLKGDSQALEALLQKIKENPVVQSICYLPLNAAFVVHTFKYKGQSLPSTVYEIYLSVITSIVSRHFSREGKGHDLPRELASLADLSKSRVAGKKFQRLCEMAHRGVMQNKVTFSSSEFPEGSSTLSLLQGIESFLEGGKSVFYNFLHLIIQEIMSAYHIATQLSNSEQVSQFQQLFNKPRFAAVFQFYSAITKLETPGMRDVVARMVSENSNTLLVSLLHCLYEAQDPSLCFYVAEQLKYKLYLTNASLGPLDCLSLSFFLFSVVSSDCKEVDVDLGKCHIGDLGVNCLTKYLSSDIDHGGKVALNLGNNDIHEEGASYIAKMLCSSNIVEHLYFLDNPIGDTGASFISNAVRETTSLKTLNMYDCGITSQGAEELSRALAPNTSLEKLDIGWNDGVGDEGIRHIAEALEHNKQLKELLIGGCGVTDKGAAYLASALSVNNTLKMLEMGGGGVLTKDGLSKLTQSLSHNTGLIKLVVPLNLSSITKYYKQELTGTRVKVGLPSIEIYGEWLLSRVHKEKRVSNFTIAAHKRCFRSTKYTCIMFSTTQWHETIVQKYAR